MLKKIVLTGGPCAGKTTALNYLSEKLSDYGYSVIVVPEIPTFVINSGLHPPKTNSAYFAFQKLMLEAQVLFEDKVFIPAAQIKGGENQVIIFDRGCLDYRAYTSEEEFARILRDNIWNVVDLRDKRYDAVIHLVTAADGQPGFYNYNNSARRETPEGAVKADLRTRKAWLGHPHLRVIDNSTDFEGKMKRLLNIVRGILGIPTALEIERKFIINSPLHLGNIPCPCQTVEIEQAYIGSDVTDLVRIRCRSQKGQGAVYYETKKLNIGSDVTRVETEKQITKEMYDEKMKYRDQDTDVIRKTRTCFLYNNQYFELDFFVEPERLQGLMLLEIELTEENEVVAIPEWLGDVEDVTSDRRYKNSFLARKPDSLRPLFST